ncbi:Ig-like domain-containing protein [Lacrimispora sp.]|uniref:Ig-like domain-containing protein n=1 Tax=Lacrimispora sp. TaxID=2719234 RepID=UPI0028ABE7B7|nr:Ig-like domain-containing protein [Lacrimispora sp.]
MDTLNDVFNETMEREGIDIIIGSSKHKVFLRRNDKADTSLYSTLYTYYNDNIEQGNTFSLNGNKYLILKRSTSENTTYQKYTCVMCNATIKMMYGAGDFIVYDVRMDENIQDSLNVNSSVITTGSKGAFLLSLNDESKRLRINYRFYCGAYILPWKIIDINYLNNMVYVYAERTPVSDNDDRDDGIADRWNYETKPNKYVIDIKESAVEIQKGKTQPLTVTVSKDDSTMNPQPTVEWTINDNSICSIDSYNIVTGLSVGQTKIIGSYKVNVNDKVKTDSVNITVTEPSTEVGEIQINPPYDYSSYYGLFQGDTETFICSINGVSSPQWNITLNASGIASANYTSTIDNATGTFIVQNNKLTADKYLIYTIRELNTGKSVTYNIQLRGLF